MKIPYRLFQQLAAAIDARGIFISNPKPAGFLVIPLTKPEITIANALRSIEELGESVIADGCGMFTLEPEPESEVIEVVMPPCAACGDIPGGCPACT